ncbi:uncharacterized protein CLUP02_16049 [Colletotrichum lupini]|uniref:Uncharacterized protein n=1 Tax=Colletotrichum lupini TaxID=145971 RepID=A0A9Q8WP43_9PEZI|nr:uncharacterized protein CLUP02_16049 [Colletotrichum lupini]UQC90519.1 hypothetical protein CLUP02_16049 [Colletotrichum lupini]
MTKGRSASSGSFFSSQNICGGLWVCGLGRLYRPTEPCHLISGLQ